MTALVCFLRFLIVLALLTTAAQAHAFGPDNSLCWIPPAGTVSGYKVYFGTTTGKYSPPIDVKLNQQPNPLGGVCLKLSAIGSIPEGNVFAVVTAYNSNGESGFSNESAFSFSALPPTTTVPTTSTTTTTDLPTTSTTTTLPILTKTIWKSTVVPKMIDAGADKPVELGLKFRSDSDGSISGVRFYKAVANTGPHVVSLWSTTGVRMATTTATSESASGWQQMNFSSPVAIAANTVYVVSYHTLTGHFSVDRNYFVAAFEAPPLYAIGSVYRYGAAGVFPTSTILASNYWVDVVFTASVKLSSITVAPVDSTIAVGATKMFTAIGTYSDGSTQDLTGRAEWSVSGDGTVTVSAVLDGIAGSASITVTASTGATVTGGLVTGVLK